MSGVPGRAWLLRGLAMLIPFGLLALLETGLRLGGYGSAYPLFVPSPDDARYRMPNPEIIDRYFAAGTAPSLAIEPNYFRREKPPDGIRIVVQGGSSAAGFPLESGAALARLLGYRLQQSFPDQTVEVIDTAMSAVSSYTLLDFADEIIAERPDAVLVYAGHNEFVGIFGTGSVAAGPGSPALIRLTFALDGFRLFQLARNLYAGIRIALSDPRSDGTTTLMAAIAGAQEIPLDSEIFRRGIRQWRENLAALIERYSAAGIPVLIGTVASNLRDQAPFISAPLPAAVAAELAAPLAAIRESRLDEVSLPVLARIEELAATHGSADLYFAAAAVREQRGEYAAAREAYQLARDHDLLRFRAPDAINRTTIELAATTPARLVDVAAVFAETATHGIVGEDLMLEHLHPTPDGYFLLADAYYQALAATAIPAPFPVTVPTAAAREELWIFPAERYFARAAIAQLKSDFPFSPSPRSVELPPVRSASDQLGRAWFDDRISWLELAEASRELVADDPLLRAIASQRIADVLPLRPEFAERAAADWLAAGRPATAARYLRQR